MKLPATTLTGRLMPGGDAVNLVLHRAGVGVDIDAVWSREHKFHEKAVICGWAMWR